MARSKIVVTGLGALAPNGNSVDQFWANSIAGKSGIGPVSQFNTEGHRVTIAGELSDFDPESVLDSR
ncbi:MAG: beta-ketoacyl synthase N-terminal-like domain-containing protein, partial [Candidatus Neomarinimicrobiota bacterium]|nr:beta-ketoacyl synthase N-terminal-like domain-containing protein [Candidatus Neomarinimicrobiota bacterium]